MSRPLCCAVFLSLALSSRGAAQSGPEAAAQAFGDAIKANDWPAAARLMSPDALKQLRDIFEPLLLMPEGEQLGVQIFGVQSEAELAATPDTVLFANFLRNTLAMEVGVAEALRSSTFTPLGHVAGGGDTVLVVSRMTLNIEGIGISQFEVMPFVLRDGRWWGLLKTDVTNMAAILSGAMGASGS